MKGKAFPVLLGLIAALGLFLRLQGLGAESFWGDEINMIRFSRGERPLELSFGNALLYLPVLRLFGGGGGEFAFRLPAALFGAATVPLVALLALRWDGRKSAALLAALFVALAPAHLALSQEAHAYGAFVFFVVAGLLGAEKAGREGGFVPWLGFAAIAGLATHLHLFLFFLMPPLAAAALLARGHLRRPSRDELRWAAAAAALYLAIVAPLLWRWVLPLAGGLLTKASGAATGVEYFDKHHHLFAVEPALFSKAFRELMVWQGTFPWVVWAAAALLLAGLAALWRQRPAAAALVILFVALALPPITYFSWQSGIDFGTRRLLFLLPLFALPAAAGCLAAGRLAVLILRQPRRAELAGGMAGLLAAALYAGSATAGYYVTETKFDLRSSARLIDLRARPGDLILVFTLDRLSLYRPPRPEDTFEMHEVWWYRKHLEVDQLRRRLLVFWPPGVAAKRFGELAGKLDQKGAIDIPLGARFELTLFDPAASPAELRAQAREMVEALIAIKGERPYLRDRLAALASDSEPAAVAAESRGLPGR